MSGFNLSLPIITEGKSMNYRDPNDFYSPVENDLYEDMSKMRKYYNKFMGIIGFFQLPKNFKDLNPDDSDKELSILIESREREIKRSCEEINKILERKPQVFEYTTGDEYGMSFVDSEIRDENFDIKTVYYNMEKNHEI